MSQRSKEVTHTLLFNMDMEPDWKGVLEDYSPLGWVPWQHGQEGNPTSSQAAWATSMPKLPRNQGCCTFWWLLEAMSAYGFLGESVRVSRERKVFPWFPLAQPEEGPKAEGGPTEKLLDGSLNFTTCHCSPSFEWTSSDNFSDIAGHSWQLVNVMCAHFEFSFELLMFTRVH